MASGVSIDGAQDEDIMVFTEATKKSRIRLDQWNRISALKKDNNSSLAEEMENTASELEVFVEDLENAIRIKKFRRESLGSDVYDSCKTISTDINEKIELGTYVMERVVELLGIRNKKNDLAQESSNDTVSYNKETSFDKDRQKAKERIDKLSDHMKELLARFARILDEEGINHKYPVPKLAPQPLPIPAYELREPKEYIASKEEARKKELPVAKDLKKAASTTITRSSKSKIRGDISNVRSPVQFLEEYALLANQNVELTQVSARRTAWYLEYIYSCKIFNIVGEGRGKSKEHAKQEAASQVISTIISRQNRGFLTPEMPSLTTKQMDFGISLLCEAIDYEEELLEICAKESHRPPIFTVMTKGKIYIVRCNALNVSAVAKARTRSLARRMAAKNIINIAMDEKRKAKEALRARNESFSR